MTDPDAQQAEWVLVPRVPTEAMVKAFVDLAIHGDVLSHGGWPGYARDQWSAMLSAAPPAQQAGDGLQERFRALHDAARGCSFDLVPADGPIARLTLFVHEHGDQLLAAMAQQPLTDGVERDASGNDNSRGETVTDGRSGAKTITDASAEERLRIGWWNDMKRRGVSDDVAIRTMRPALAHTKATRTDDGEA